MYYKSKLWMNGIWCNLPEVWTSMNRTFDISDMGNIRKKEDRVVLHRFKGRAGYSCVTLFGTQRYIHQFVLKTFLPKPSPMFNMCDHIDRNRMNPELVNLRWSNAVLNGLNKEGVKGHYIVKYKGVDMYITHIRLLGMPFRFTPLDDPDMARAQYEYWQRRAFAIIEALCSLNLHWKFQRMILEYWMPIKHGRTDRMKFERDDAYAQLPLCGRLF